MLTVACHDCRGCPRSEAPQAGNAGTSNDGCDELRPRGSTILDVDVIARGKTHLPAERLTCAHGLARFQDHSGFEREPLIGPAGAPKKVSHSVAVHISHGDVGNAMLRIVRLPLQGLSVEIVDVDL